MPAPDRIDLHTHSSASDGTEDAATLVREAVAAGLDVVGLTDHDTTAGWSAAFEGARGSGLTVLPGIELSTQLDYASVHVLGYLIDPDAAGLRALTDELRAERVERAQTMVARIGRDYDLGWDDVLAQTTPGATVGRPHIADALVAKGHVSDRSAAFRSILHWRGGYYQPHLAPEPTVGVRLIREAGGVPVIAHPGGRGPRELMTEERIRSLVAVGLAGVEVDHRDNDPAAKEKWIGIAERFGLIRTGSSDYHGTGKPNRLAENTTRRDQYERIVELGTGSVPFRG